MRICYILSSIPGSGKTTWAKNFKACNLNTFIVSSDEIRKELGGTYQYFKEEERVWKIFFSRGNKIAKEHKDCNVILDSTCINDYYRHLYFMKTNAFDKHVLVLFDVPFSECRKRNKNRIIEKQVPDFAFDDLLKRFKKPSKEIIEEFDDYLIISN